MLVHDFLQIPQAYADVHAAVLRDPHLLIDANAAAACRSGEELCEQLQPWLRHPGLPNQVWVDLGDVYVRGAGLILPLHWWVQGASPLFPRLDADLEVMPVGPNATHLALSGRYEPAPSTLGQELDKTLSHRLVEGSVRAFLLRLATSLDPAHIDPDAPGPLPPRVEPVLSGTFQAEVSR